LYIKPLFPISKQFSIDSFLGWEGNNWVFLLINASHRFLLSLLQRTELAKNVYKIASFKKEKSHITLIDFSREFHHH